MKITDLPSTQGLLSTGGSLRTALVKSLNELQIAINAGNSSAGDKAEALQDLLDAGTAKVTALLAKVLSITVTPASSSGAASGTTQLAVSAKKADGTTATVTGTATYASSDTEVATVSAGGLITRVAVGSAVVTVSYAGFSKEVPVTVTA